MHETSRQTKAALEHGNKTVLRPSYELSTDLHYARSHITNFKKNTYPKQLLLPAKINMYVHEIKRLDAHRGDHNMA